MEVVAVLEGRTSRRVSKAEKDLFEKGNPLLLMDAIRTALSSLKLPTVYALYQRPVCGPDKSEDHPLDGWWPTGVRSMTDLSHHIEPAGGGMWINGTVVPVDDYLAWQENPTTRLEIVLPEKCWDIHASAYHAESEIESEKWPDARFTTTLPYCTWPIVFDDPKEGVARVGAAELFMRWRSVRISRRNPSVSVEQYLMYEEVPPLIATPKHPDPQEPLSKEIRQYTIFPNSVKHARQRGWI